ncbi:hypothetical protein FCOIX_2224 [Fusarium coicis]|nr:hypothetical protein FCOIX_2224 [Fusarium coicis]
MTSLSQDASTWYTNRLANSFRSGPLYQGDKPSIKKKLNDMLKANRQYTHNQINKINSIPESKTTINIRVQLIQDLVKDNKYKAFTYAYHARREDIYADIPQTRPSALH